MPTSSDRLVGMPDADAQSRWWPIILIAALPLANLLAFTWDAANRAIIEDQWYFLPMVQDYFAGQFHLFSLWATHSQHRTPGYKLLFLLNAVFFNLDMRLETMFGLAALAAGLLLIMWRFRETLPEATPPATRLLGLLSIAIIACNLNQWSDLVYSLTALAGYVSVLCFVVIWLVLDTRLRRGVNGYGFLLLCLGTAFTLLTFAAGMGPAFVASLIAVPAAAMWAQRRFEPTTIRLLAWVGLYAAVCEALYWGTGGIHLSNPHVPSFLGLATAHPAQALQFLVLSYAASLMPADAMEKHLPVFGRDLNLIVGLGVICLYAGCTYRYCRLRLWETSYVPAFMMAFSTFFILSTLVTRLPTAGVQGSEAPRYVLYSQLGLIGCLWVMYQWCGSDAPSGRLRHFANPVFIFGATTLLYSLGLASLWSYHPQAVLNKEIAVHEVLSGDFGTTDWVCLDQTLCVAGRKTLQQYGLNVFANQPAPPASHP